VRVNEVQLRSITKLACAALAQVVGIWTPLCQKRAVDFLGRSAWAEADRDPAPLMLAAGSSEMSLPELSSLVVKDLCIAIICIAMHYTRCYMTN